MILVFPSLSAVQELVSFMGGKYPWGFKLLMGMGSKNHAIPHNSRIKYIWKFSCAVNSFAVNLKLRLILTLYQSKLKVMCKQSHV